MKKLRQITTVKRHVLIVDDEVVNREILGNILSVNYEVEYADNVRLTGATETARSLATATGVTIRVPKIEAATQFFRIAVNLTAR